MKSIANNCYDISSFEKLNLFAQHLSLCLTPGMVFYVYGDLGAGKTTLAQHVFKQAGGEDNLTSPTFSLLESYDLGEVTFIHMDLYRINHASEIEALGLRDYLALNPIWWIEWPQRVAQGKGLPTSSVSLHLKYNPLTEERLLFIPALECCKIGLQASL